MLLSRAERILFLKKVELFGALEPDVIGQLASLAAERSLAAGDVLVAQGEHADALFLIARGRVRVVVDGVEVARRTAGDCIGEVSLFDGRPRSATVSAESDVVVLRLDAELFDELLASEPSVAEGVAGVLASRLREALADCGEIAPPRHPRGPPSAPGTSLRPPRSS